MLMTIYWYGVLTYIIGVILVCVKIIYDERWRNFLTTYTGGDGENLNVIKVIVSGMIPILHWLYAIGFIWIFLNDNEWNEISDKIIGQDNDER